MSVLAVLCWRGLDTILVSRDRLTRAADELQALTISFSQMDEDLRRSWPARMLEPGHFSIRFDGQEGRLESLHMLREGGAALDPVRIERVAYRLKDGRLERGYAEYIRGVALNSVNYRWQTLLEKVQALQFRAWISGRGWVAQAVEARPGEQLVVTGVEVVAELENRQNSVDASIANRRFIRIFAVKD
jgi:general secretion pathway protein J